MSDTRHIPVLREEVVAHLQADVGGRFLDCTVGGGGHTAAILAAHKDNFVVACDRDKSAVARVRERFKDERFRVTIHHTTFSALSATVTGSFDGILADLGMSTDQIYSGRGFSFHDKGLLDMRMDSSQSVTAAELVNERTPGELLRIFRAGGLTSGAKQIVNAIIKNRPITSPQELTAIAANAAPRRHAKESHPATVVFQALRIEVNQEFREIDALLETSAELLAPGGRLAIISFHSLEDKKVTRTLRSWEQGDTRPARWRDGGGPPSKGELLTRKALVPSDDEITKNPASRSARLRVFKMN